MLWILQAGEKHGYDLQDYPEPPKAGLTSVLADRKLPQEFLSYFGIQSVRIACGTHRYVGAVGGYDSPTDELAISGRQRGETT